MKSKNSLFLLLVVALTVLAGVGFRFTQFYYGLDVKGGIRLTYQMDMTSVPPGTNPADLQSNLKRILDERVSGLAREGNVYPRDNNQFVVEIPGYSDLETARSLLNATAKVQVFHATTVDTKLRPGVYHADPGESGPKNSPYIGFTDSVGNKLVPGDARYQKMIDSWTVILEGDQISDAKPFVEGTRTEPIFSFSPSGSTAISDWSHKYYNKGENLAFVLDGKVLNIAPLKDGAILGDGTQVEGQFDPAYVVRITDLIRSGALPVKLNELSSQQVDATIGSQALNQIVIAGAIAMLITGIYLVFYYYFPGAVAFVAMLLYTLFTITVLKLIGATFSLAAIAGFILSVAMAVDANILVFERIKEEINSGKRLTSAIELGFRRALTAIIDSNLSTVITSFVLFYFGDGPVKGFALTLIIGVAISFFTAIMVTRSLLVGINGLGLFNDSKYFAIHRKWFFEKDWTHKGEVMNVIHNARTYFLISGALIVPGLIFLSLGGLKPNVEFQGGFEGEYTLSNQVSADTMRRNLAAHGFPGANIKFANLAKVVYVTIPPNKLISLSDSGAKQKIADAAGIQYSSGSISSVGPTIRQQTITNAVAAVLISSALIVLFLAFRFGTSIGGMKNGVKFGASAVAALLHDVVFVIGAAACLGFTLGWEVSALFITAMLTVIGFSVHDTIVIFDRIRENLMKPYQGESFEHVIDKSITQSFARSLNTSMTAIVTLIILIIFGTPTPELKFMCTTMLLGITIGTYSSIFNAAPILYLWDKWVVKNKGEQVGLVAEAQREAKNRAMLAARVPVTPDRPAPAAPTTYNQPVAPTDPTKTSQYGQVRRRRSAADQVSKDLED